MGEGISRRQLLAAAAQAAAAIAIGGCSKGEQPVKVERPERKSGPGKLAVAKEKDAAASTRAAVAAIGGMAAFVRKGDTVVVKPNAAWARPPDAAASTHPDVLSAIIKMCKEAGAGEILVVEHLIDKPTDMVLALSGIRAAAEKSGARMIAAENESMYRKIEIPGGKVITSEQVAKDILKADVFINVPKAKVHGSTKLTLGMKNLMGIIWNRQAWHTSSSLDGCIVDLASAIKPDLTIVDATRILLTNGPKGPGETKDPGQVIAGTDQVAVDACAATLFDMKPEEIEHIVLAHKRGLGEIDYKKLLAS